MFSTQTKSRQPVGRALGFGATLLLGTTLTQAAVLVENRDSSGDVTTIWIEKSMVSISVPNETQHLLIDLENKKEYLVNDADKTVMDISGENQGGALPAPAAPPAAVVTKIDKQGAGPKILGHSTEKYLVKANGNLCFEEFVAPDLVNVEELQRFFVYLAEQETPAGLHADNEPCADAEQTLNTRYRTLGVPLRSIAPDGTIENETITLKLDAAPPAGQLKFPETYRRMSPADMGPGGGQ